MKLFFDQLPPCSLLIIFKLFALRDVQHHGVTFLAIGESVASMCMVRAGWSFLTSSASRAWWAWAAKTCLNEGVEGGSLGARNEGLEALAQQTGALEAEQARAGEVRLGNHRHYS